MYKPLQKTSINFITNNNSYFLLLQDYFCAVANLIELELQVLLEIELQVCCNDGNVHEVDGMLVLSSVEVLVYIQGLGGGWRS